MFKRLRKWLGRYNKAKPLQPHEKAELGLGTWGRQPEPGKMGTKAEPKATISARVIKKDGTIEDLGIISGGK